MSTPSITPASEPAGAVVIPAPRRGWRLPPLLAASAALHVSLLAASARMQAPEPPPPRVVEVLRWEAYEAPEGALAWRNAGGTEHARLRTERSR